ncbi:hypothetical protein DSUL_20110 [Desulfovibrionales bacterium]
MLTELCQSRRTRRCRNIVQTKQLFAATILLVKLLFIVSTGLKMT